MPDLRNWTLTSECFMAYSAYSDEFGSGDGKNGGSASHKMGLISHKVLLWLFPSRHTVHVISVLSADCSLNSLSDSLLSLELQLCVKVTLQRLAD